MKKLIVAAAISLTTITSVQAADIASTLSKTTSVSVTSVDRKVTGTVNTSDIKVGVTRGEYNSSGAGACNGCIDTNSNYALGVTIDVTNRVDTIDTVTGGTSTTTSLTCLEDLMVGGLSATDGVTTSTTSVNTKTFNNNSTIITGGSFEINTNVADNKYNSDNLIGNDVNFVVDGVHASTGDSNFNLQELAKVVGDGVDTWSVSGQDMQNAPETGIQVVTSKTDLKVLDRSVTTDTSTTNKVTTFSSIK